MNALDGIKVVDLTHAISGPTCTQMLRQLGAEVIKIEPPEVGDAFRHYTEHAGLPKMSIPFAAVNAGKKSVTLNLKSPEGLAIARRLASEADIVVENFRPGVLARLGLGYETLRADNPGVILLSLSGFGQTGPMKDWGAYDHIAQAVSGMAVMNANADGPQKVGMPIVDSFSGYLGVIALLAALRKRDATGVGEYCDVAMLDAALKLIATGVSVWSYTGEAPKGTGNRGYRLVATAEFYPTADDWIALGANHQHQIAAMFRVFGHGEMIDDPRFRDHQARVENYAALKAWLTDYLSARSAADLERDLTAAGVPAARIRDVGQIAADPHLAQRGLLHQAALSGTQQSLAVVGPGFKVEPPAEMPTVPRLGDDTDAVLAGLGYDEAAIARLRGAGIV
ncbi:CaiB/BaiF CoA-transferase family protein [Sphingosinicella sp. BN140058]|uniref:CaiB/BaiF CoA transferase family protein n=1 Tax=Sphingosinicella sp. BN140058 TaxID=1892855 RepID=UPI00101076D7|nr:CaiB/BaiF CoA-transferase family protein [Sphingosinicella sp. BN140058]QAY75288.1 CoA transferase [Sphingosinicella sp. BN140058]